MSEQIIANGTITKYIPICMQVVLDSKSPSKIILYLATRIKVTLFLLGLAGQFLVTGKIFPTDKEWEQAVTPPFGKVDR